MAFSLPIKDFDKTTPSVMLTVAGISRLNKHAENGLDSAWIFFLDPEGNDYIICTLITGQYCGSGGVCASDGASLGEMSPARARGTAGDGRGTGIPGRRGAGRDAAGPAAEAHRPSGLGQRHRACNPQLVRARRRLRDQVPDVAPPTLGRREDPMVCIEGTKNTASTQPGTDVAAG